MKSAFFLHLLPFSSHLPMAKVHKSVGIGSAAHCNDDDDVNVNLFDKSEKSRNYQYFLASTAVLKPKYSSTYG